MCKVLLILTLTVVNALAVYLPGITYTPLSNGACNSQQSFMRGILIDDEVTDKEMHPREISVLCSDSGSDELMEPALNTGGELEQAKSLPQDKNVNKYVSEQMKMDALIFSVKIFSGLVGIGIIICSYLIYKKSQLR